MTNRFPALDEVFGLHGSLFKIFCLGGLLSILFACSPPPPRPFATDAAPMDQIPESLIGVTDDRARFREIYCEVLEARKLEQPDYRSCDVALTRVADEKPGSGLTVELEQSDTRLKVFFVPGVGWDCFTASADIRTPEQIRMFVAIVDFPLIGLRILRFGDPV